VLKFADDIKLMLPVSTVADCVNLQHDLDSVLHWSRENRLSVNISKSVCMSYTRRRRPCTYDYSVDNVSLVRVEHVKDLGVTFDNKLTFHKHIQTIVTQSYKLLGFIFRNTPNNQDPDCILLLYKSLIRSKLEYSSVVWSPATKKKINYLEKVQSRLVRRLFFTVNGFYPSYPEGISCQALCEALDLQSLSGRRQVHGLLFLYKLLNHQTDSAELLNKLSFEVPRANIRARNRMFSLPRCRTELQVNSPLYRISALYNTLAEHVDVFANSIKKFTQLISARCT
jgi:hypothetical protein